MNVDAIIITDLFKGNQLEEMRHWLDNETPYWEDDTWERASSGVMKKRCPELNMYHMATLDRAREIFVKTFTLFAPPSWCMHFLAF